MVIWRTISDFPSYAVSNVGCVRRVMPDKKGRIGDEDLRPSLDTDGYLQVRLFNGGKGCTKKVHRLVCDAFHGPAPSPSHQVAHSDGNRKNNHAVNLRWATAKENAKDRDIHGRTARGASHPSRLGTDYLPSGDAHWSRKYPQRTTKGEAHGCARMTDENIRAIRNDTRMGVEIAQDYGVTPTTISHIRNRKTWTHIQ